MTPEERLSNFFTALVASNPIWYDGLPLVFPGKDIKEAVKKSWITLHAEGKLKPPVDWREARNLVNKTLTWQEPKNSDGYEKAVPVEIHPQALTGEARLQKIKEWEEAHKKVGNPETTREHYKAFKEIREIKKIDYTPLTGRQIYERDRHLAYLRECYDPLTKEPKNEWIDEAEFNKLYDSGLI